MMATLIRPTNWNWMRARVEGTLGWFSGKMQEAMQHHADKGEWVDRPSEDLTAHLAMEVAELSWAMGEAKDPSLIIDECADIANLAMLIADRTRILSRQDLN